MTVCPYEKSPFCSRMSAEDRNAICPNCKTFRFHKKADAQESCKKVSQQLKPDSLYYCIILLEGLISTDSTRNADFPSAFLLWQPGDIISGESILGVSNPLEPLYHRTYLKDGAYAALHSEDLKTRFKQNPDFAIMLYQNLAQTHLHQTTFLLGTRFNDAASRLKYLLLFCQENSIPALTHQDFAYLTGLNRTTVTKTLKQILAKEDLSIPLKDYIRSMYKEN